MNDDFDYFISLESNNCIDISNLLQDMCLPVRIMNVLKSKKFFSEKEFYDEVLLLTSQYTSHYLFPNDMVAFYPQVLEKMALKDMMCYLSGAKIYKGSTYFIYYPFIENLVNGKCYTVKKRIQASMSYQDYFPQDITSYEEWYYKLKNAYFTTNGSDIIDFYNLSVNCGNSCLELYELGNRKKKGKMKYDISRL